MKITYKHINFIYILIMLTEISTLKNTTKEIKQLIFKLVYYKKKCLST